MPDDPHVTTAVKNPEQARAGTHQAAHGYTKSLEDLEVIHVKLSRVVKSDDTRPRGGKSISPSTLRQEEKVHKE